ncbi:hypothetical protein [Psychrobacter phenylpyruvicus]|uniref:Uncharacterized protein n=1 Tax=Psychrobacter phenylpyruvicus TaxID=29432 RepID=A0A379LIQ1_9GAMM|nr:hypothetical protein [Psychrobacter phenylpyruvicus]SUD89797.1 Uncharacterised protein [Psychrobacter phenylpyruvicus]
MIIHSGKFELPNKLLYGNSNCSDWIAVVNDATKTSIERPKKP